jgi:hypothetical protein
VAFLASVKKESSILENTLVPSLSISKSALGILDGRGAISLGKYHIQMSFKLACEGTHAEINKSPLLVFHLWRV